MKVTKGKSTNVQKNFSEFNSLNEISLLKEHYQAKHILLITGKESFTLCGARKIIETQLNIEEVTMFNEFSVNPKIEDCVFGAELAVDNNVDLILAIGGGSVLDMAKLIKAFIPSPQEAKSIAQGRKPVQATNIPLIAVPTTAGSGSEATHFAVVYVNRGKLSLASPYLLPDKVILDASLLKSANAYQRAINGLDALAQAIEGCWAVNSTAETRHLSLKAIQLLIKHLPCAIENNNVNDLQNIQYAANLAGKVINSTKTTAPHAFSYAFTSYHNVPHGHAVWLTLPAIFEIHMDAASADIIDKRGRKHLKPLMKSLAKALNIDSKRPKDSLQAFMRVIGVEPSMEVMGINTNIRKSFAANQVNIERLSNNPVSITDKQIASIFNIQ